MLMSFGQSTKKLFILITVEKNKVCKTSHHIKAIRSESKTSPYDSIKYYVSEVLITYSLQQASYMLI